MASYAVFNDLSVLRKNRAHDLPRKKVLQARVEVLEVQQAVTAGFVLVLLQIELHHLPEAQRTLLPTTHESLFERTIAGLLASEVGFSDAAIHAIELLKVNMMQARLPDKDMVVQGHD